MNDEMEITWREPVVAQFKVFQCPSERSEVNSKNLIKACSGHSGKKD